MERLRTALEDALDDLSSPRTPHSTQTAALLTLERLLAAACVPSRASEELEYFLALQYTFECNVPSRILSWVRAATLRMEGAAAAGKDSSDSEELSTLSTQLALALSVLQGVALTHAASKRFLGRRAALETLLDLFLAARHLPLPSAATSTTSASSTLDTASPPAPPSPPTTPIASSALDTLLCILVDAPRALRAFEAASGPHAVVRVLKRAATPREVRMKCLEFLYFYLLDETGAPASTPVSPTKPMPTGEGAGAPPAYTSRPTPTAPSTPLHPAGRAASHRRTQSTEVPIPTAPSTPLHPAPTRTAAHRRAQSTSTPLGRTQSAPVPAPSTSSSTSTFMPISTSTPTPTAPSTPLHPRTPSGRTPSGRTPSGRTQGVRKHSSLNPTSAPRRPVSRYGSSTFALTSSSFAGSSEFGSGRTESFGSTERSSSFGSTSGEWASTDSAGSAGSVRSGGGTSRAASFASTDSGSSTGSTGSTGSIGSTGSKGSVESNASSTPGSTSPTKVTQFAPASPTKVTQFAAATRAGSTSPVKQTQFAPASPTKPTRAAQAQTPAKPRALLMLRRELDFVPLSPQANGKVVVNVGTPKSMPGLKSKPSQAGEGEGAAPIRVGMEKGQTGVHKLSRLGSGSWEEDGEGAGCGAEDEYEDPKLGEEHVPEECRRRDGTQEWEGRGETRTTVEKTALLGTMLGNVEALVEGVRRAGVWGLG
ncbi:cell division control protein 14, SIN component-domain-containing protein [Mycena latifolia]|nr:cell division control protein 14, SIN component-domain-containing protein [Mycena latifolia]